jgi:choline dehydrogenase
MRPPVPPAQPDSFLRQWIDTGRSIYTSNGAVMAILKKSARSKLTPDLLIFGLVTNFRGYYPGYSLDVSSAHQYFTWTILKGYTHNTAGQVAIRSRDPQDVPDINFHYFDEGNDATTDDLDAVVGAIEFTRSMTASYRDQLIEREEVPGDKVRTRDELRQWVKDEAWGHHASCTCKIGRRDDPMAVLDSKFRVYGTKGLRVVDASVFPRIPGLFIVSAIYMAAEKASDVILSDGEQPRK